MPFFTQNLSEHRFCVEIVSLRRSLAAPPLSPPLFATLDTGRVSTPSSTPQNAYQQQHPTLSTVAIMAKRNVYIEADPWEATEITALRVPLLLPPLLSVDYLFTQGISRQATRLCTWRRTSIMEYWVWRVLMLVCQVGKQKGGRAGRREPTGWRAVLW